MGDAGDEAVVQPVWSLFVPPVAGTLESFNTEISTVVPLKGLPACPRERTDSRPRMPSLNDSKVDTPEHRGYGLVHAA